MKIFAVNALPVTCSDGTVVLLRPGKHDYPMISNKDSVVSEQLRVYRKHGRIGFDEYLPSDVELLAKMPGKADKTAELIKLISLKPNPVGREVKNETRRNKGLDKPTGKSGGKGGKS